MRRSEIRTQQKQSGELSADAWSDLLIAPRVPDIGANSSQLLTAIGSKLLPGVAHSQLLTFNTTVSHDADAALKGFASKFMDAGFEMRQLPLLDQPHQRAVVFELKGPSQAATMASYLSKVFFNELPEMKILLTIKESKHEPTEAYFAVVADRRVDGLMDRFFKNVLDTKSCPWSTAGLLIEPRSTFNTSGLFDVLQAFDELTRTRCTDPKLRLQFDSRPSSLDWLDAEAEKFGMKSCRPSTHFSDYVRYDGNNDKIFIWKAEHERARIQIEEVNSGLSMFRGLECFPRFCVVFSGQPSIQSIAFLRSIVTRLQHDGLRPLRGPSSARLFRYFDTHTRHAALCSSLMNSSAIHLITSK